MRITYRVHALQRMFQRGINQDTVRQVLETGKTIEDYPADHPYPSRLILGWDGTRPIHVVSAHNETNDEAIVITVYEPEQARWSNDFRTRIP